MNPKRPVVNASADPTVRQRFVDQGQEMPPRDQQTPEAQVEKWWPIIKGRTSRRNESLRSRRRLFFHSQTPRFAAGAFARSRSL
jgi:hypothetical protein